MMRRGHSISLSRTSSKILKNTVQMGDCLPPKIDGMGENSTAVFLGLRVQVYPCYGWFNGKPWRKPKRLCCVLHYSKVVGTFYVGKTHVIAPPEKIHFAAFQTPWDESIRKYRSERFQPRFHLAQNGCLATADRPRGAVVPRPPRRRARAWIPHSCNAGSIRVESNRVTEFEVVKGFPFGVFGKTGAQGISWSSNCFFLVVVGWFLW